MQFIKIFWQRLTSPAGFAAAKEAYMELGVIGVGLGMLYGAIKQKDFSAALTEAPQFWSALLAFIIAVRSIFSSNVKAIQNPALPKITGDGSIPVLVTEPQSDVKLPPDVAAPKP